jgi:hypothetical protein
MHTHTLNTYSQIIYIDQLGEIILHNRAIEFILKCTGFSRGFCPKQLTTIHTSTAVSTMQGNSQLIGSSEG